MSLKRYFRERLYVFRCYKSTLSLPPSLLRIVSTWTNENSHSPLGSSFHAPAETTRERARFLGPHRGARIVYVAVFIVDLSKKRILLLLLLFTDVHTTTCTRVDIIYAYTHTHAILLRTYIILCDSILLLLWCRLFCHTGCVSSYNFLELGVGQDARRLNCIYLRFSII